MATSNLPHCQVIVTSSTGLIKNGLSCDDSKQRMIVATVSRFVWSGPKCTVSFFIWCVSFLHCNFRPWIWQQTTCVQRSLDNWLKPTGAGQHGKLQNVNDRVAATCGTCSAPEQSCNYAHTKWRGMMSLAPDHLTFRTLNGRSQSFGTFQ